MHVYRRCFPFSPAAVLLLLAGTALAAPYTVKLQKATPPTELSAAIAKELSDNSIELLNAKGTVLAQVWFRKTIPAKSASFSGPPTYQDLQETTLLGAIRFPAEVRDYRKKAVKPGVYTLRLGFQPMDGDHMGTAPDPYFALVVQAARDKDPGAIADPKKLYKLSGKSTGKSHAGVFLLVPVDKLPTAPHLVNEGSGAWAVETKTNATAGGHASPLGIALTLIGYSSAA